MTDLLKQGSDWLESTRDSYLASQILYRRGVTTATVNATFGKTDYEVEDDYGLSVGTSIVDFLILAASLSVFVEPKSGDQIVYDGRVYEVMSLLGQGNWRWSDSYRTTMRIHTKDIGNEEE